MTLQVLRIIVGVTKQGWTYPVGEGGEIKSGSSTFNNDGTSLI